MRSSRWFLMFGALVSGVASAAEDETVVEEEAVPEWSGDIAFAYGRNIGQRLNVGGLVGEVKRNIHPRVAVGGRIGSLFGAGVSEGDARAYVGVPILVKGEGYLNESRTRPYAGLGLGITYVTASGVVTDLGTGSVATSAYGVAGPMFTAMPELGVDLGGLRVAVQHGFLVGSSRSVAASVEAGVGGTSVEVNGGGYPGLGGTTVQIGAHFGGPRKH